MSADSIILLLLSRRVVGRALACLLLGAVTSAGVAWFIAWRVVPERTWSTTNGVPPRENLPVILRPGRFTGGIVATYSGFGTRHCSLRWYNSCYSSPNHTAQILKCYERHDLIWLFKWCDRVSEVREFLGPDGPDPRIVHRWRWGPWIRAHRTGWPFYCFEGLVFDRDVHDDTWLDVSTCWVQFQDATPMTLGTWHAGYDPQGTPFPTRPILAGFALNTMIYGVVWLLLRYTTRLLPWAWRARRRRRGHCVRCGYDLLGDLASGCPECGWRRRG